MTLAGDLRSGSERFAITGATGWLGRAMLETLGEALGDALPARVQAFASRGRRIELGTGQTLDVRPLEELVACPHEVLIHLAFVTREHSLRLGLDRYVAENTEISSRIAEAIVAQRPAAIAYSSSGAVYEATGDLSANPYAELKQLDELMLRGAAASVGSRMIIARVFNVAGPWIRKPQGFAISDLIGQALAGGALTIRSDRPVRRSYLDVGDLAELLLAGLLDRSGPKETIFDTSGEVVEVGDLATRIQTVLNCPAEIHRDWDPAAPADDYLGDDASCVAVFTRLGISRRDLDEQIRRTATGLLTPVTS